jgi:hypothetical protein
MVRRRAPQVARMRTSVLDDERTWTRYKAQVRAKNMALESNCAYCKQPRRETIVTNKFNKLGARAGSGKSVRRHYMWQATGYILIIATFFCMLISRIATTQRTNRLFSYLAMGLLTAVLVLTVRPGYVEPASALLVLPAAVLSDIVARLFLKRRTLPPRVRVKGLSRISGVFIIVLLLFIPLLLFLSVVEASRFAAMTPNPILLLLVSTVAYLVLLLFQKTEICGNGIWFDGTLHPWDAYESFSWTSGGVVELRPSSRSRLSPSSSMRLTASPENVEAAKRLVEANLPNPKSATVSA